MESEFEDPKDEFYYNTYRTSISEVLCVTLTAHFCTLIVMIVNDICPQFSHPCYKECVPKSCKTVQNRKHTFFLRDFVVIIMTLTCTVTVWSESSHLLMITMSIMTVVFIVYKLKCARSLQKSLREILNTQVNDKKRSYLTCARSVVSIFSVLSILAVDFTIFPRRFAKTRTEGHSLMDVGVGLYVMSNAIVVSSDKLRQEGFKKTSIGALVLFLLGLVRLITTANVNYHVVTSEYGIHWNFFLTLGTVKLLTFFILKFSDSGPLKAAVMLSVVHQCLLCAGLQDYVFSYRARDNVLHANREGLVSVLGYTSLYLAGVWLNGRLRHKSTSVRTYLKDALQFFSWGVVLLLTTLSLEQVFPVSRCLANLTYVTWIASMTCLHVAAAVLVQCFGIGLAVVNGVKFQTLYSYLTPVLYESVNHNGLLFFLLANLLTGIVNLSFTANTLNETVSLIILISYMLVNCSVVYTLYLNGIKIKYW